MSPTISRHLDDCRDASLPLPERVHSLTAAWFALGDSCDAGETGLRACQDAEDPILALVTRHEAIVRAIQAWVDSGEDLCEGADLGMMHDLGVQHATDAARVWLRALLSGGAL